MVIDLLNTVQSLTNEVTRLSSENQELRDEINRLKGEHGRPKFKKSKKAKQPLAGTENPNPEVKAKNVSSDEKPVEVKIDRVEHIKMDRSLLPADAVFKGIKRVVQQNIRLIRDNVAYDFEVYYSKSAGRSYRAQLPEDYRGQFGYDTVSLTQLLNKFGDMTQDRIVLLYRSLGVLIGKGTISNMLLKEGEWAVGERDDILRAGLECSSFQQMDGTKTVQNGKGLNTQIICAKHFKTFYTRHSRKRLDIISVLQGLSGKQEAKLCYNRIARYFMKKFEVTLRDQQAVADCLDEGQICSLSQTWEQLEVNVHLAKAKQARRSKLNDALALGYYHTQQDYPRVNFLLSDNAKEYTSVARYGQALCWIHDVRYYRKMSPKAEYHQGLLTSFIDRYWSYYQQLKDYAVATSAQQRVSKPLLTEAFDDLFGGTSDYAELHKRMKCTYGNRERLLTFLELPCLPLHNNSAERGARRVVRKRDISLHTCSDQGTIIKDSFLSVVETARKLGVNILEYIDCRVRGKNVEHSLADLVRNQYAIDAPVL